MVGFDYMEVIVFSVSVNHVNGSLLDFTFLIPYGLYLLLCFLLKEFINSLYYKSIKSEVSISKKRFTTIKHFVYDTLIDLPNSETDILAYSDSAHKADKTVTFGKFRIFCFVETDNNLYTDLIVDSEKIHLEKSKRKGMYFIGLNEVKKKK